MSRIVNAFIIILLIYILFTFNPELVPNCVWKNKFVRKMNRYSSSILEKYTGINLANIQLEGYYENLSKQNDGKPIVMFHYAEWCPHCKEMKPIWNEVKKSITAEQVNVEVLENNEEVLPTPGIDSFPTIIKYKDGIIKKYSGEKNKHDLMMFVLS